MVFFIILFAMVWLFFIVMGIKEKDMGWVIFGILISLITSFFVSIIVSAIVVGTNNYSYDLVEEYQLVENVDNSLVICNQKKNNYSLLIQNGEQIESENLSYLIFNKSDKDSLQIVRPKYGSIARIFILDFLISNNYIFNYIDNPKIKTINKIEINSR